MDYLGRQKRLKGALKERFLDGLLIKKRQNIAYLTGIKGEDAVLFVSCGKIFLISDTKYKEEYSKGAKNYTLKIIRPKDIYACIQEIVRKLKVRRIGFESDSFSYLQYKALKKDIKHANLAPVKGIVEGLRIIKDEDEVRYIQGACKTCCYVMNYALRIVKPSFSEDSIRQKVEQFIAKKGLKKAGFDIIVASGRNASMPHAPTSKKIIKKRETIIVDLGTANYGYNSDLTRTIFLGRIDHTYRRIYDIVLTAQKKAIERIKPGTKASFIDNISRQYISYKGAGKYFIHGLGHGIGLQVHEEPIIARDSRGILQENMVVTIEPGIYIPGWGGVRIEDDVLVTKNGYKILTTSCKSSLCE